MAPPILVVIQARMSSSRMPGKVLRPFRKDPILQLQIDKLRASHAGDNLVVATSDEPSDLPIVEWCHSAGIRCERGPLNRVADRIGDVVAKSDAKYFVRFCADRPYYDWRLLDAAVDRMCELNADIVTNAFPPSYPKGQMTEVIRSASFLRALPSIQSAYDQEHVTSYFYAHAGRFHIANMFSGDEKWHDVNLALDTESDWQIFERVMSQLERAHTDYTWREFAELVAETRSQEAI